MSEQSRKEVHHNTAKSQFEITENGNLAVLQYMRHGTAIDFIHTLVPPELEGKGIGSQLARAGLDYAKNNSLHIIATCSFISAYLARHPEYGADPQSK